MPSPFPGMDPYLEHPDLWVDFHNNLAPAIQERLNRVIQPRYVARLTPSVVYDVIEIGEARVIRPDVAVVGTPPQAGNGGPRAVESGITPAPVTSSIPFEAPVELLSVEIRTTGTKQLVTAIEILSPVNKRPGHHAYLDYRRKRTDPLHSAAHFLEIDLLRAGERSPLERPVPRAAYVVTLSRATRRPTVEVWPIQISDSLPVLPIPLLEPDPDVPLDLDDALAAVYERGAYGAQIDYRVAPLPPLTDEEARWIDGRLRAQGAR